MERRAALLLIFLIGTAAISALETETTRTTTEKNLHHKTERVETTSAATTKEVKSTTEEVFSLENVDYKKLLDPKETLLQEIRSLDEKISADKTQEEVLAKVLKAEAHKAKQIPKLPLPRKTTVSIKTINSTTAKSNLKDLLESDDQAYDDLDDLDEDEEDEDDDADDDEYDDDDDDEDDALDEDVVMNQCPKHCICLGQYASATTAKCLKLYENESFGPGIAHLKIERGDPNHLGPLALRSRGLQQLESVTIIDTPLGLDEKAFVGIPYLFAVNLTRNGLEDIPVNIFQNNSQLSLLTISGNPMKHFQSFVRAKTREYLLNAPSITELDFSDNSISKLPHSIFNKMPNLVFIDLKKNRLKTVDKAHFNSLESLTELDLSYNDVQEIPIDLFEGKNVQTFRINGNNLTSLSTLTALKMTVLHASKNKIKIIHKDDLIGLPNLEQLHLRSNGLRRIHQHSFSENNELLHIDLSDNKLTSIDHHFRTNSRLQTIIMNDNPALDTLPVFRTNDQEYNTFSVYRFECSNCGLYSLQEGTFDAMPALTTLNLAKNHLTGLPKNLLQFHSSLIELNLSDNRIKTLDYNMFQGATSLTKLNLAGNLLISLQVTPFLATPNLSKLNVSRNLLERVWSEARVPLKNLRFLSVQGNRLQRITLEELKATPKLSGLDLLHNPMKCDKDFNEAIQWLMENGVSAIDNSKSISNYVIDDSDFESVKNTQWTDLAKVVCDSIDLGPPPRPVPHKPTLQDILKNDLSDDIVLDHGQNHDNEFEETWPIDDQEYEEYPVHTSFTSNSRTLWPVLTVIVISVILLLSVVHFALYLAKRRGRGPVIRPPMILRQGLVDNKNCGLVYKPLQEELPTPHMPKRGTFYSSSAFHYDKIVPESV